MTKIETLGAHFPDGVDAFITSDEKTCFYLSEFLFSDGLVFVTKKNAYLFPLYRGGGGGNCRLPYLRRQPI